MNTSQDNKWQALLALSAPTFAGEISPPYGFMTSMLAQLRQERQDEQQLVRLCWRAIFASLAALVVAAGVTVSVHGHFNRGNDFDPGMRGLIQMENIQAS
ncbi:MAG: hypothetical protein LV481_07125 [Methylacidiphilales bacterium]|nr:hypothetical protein [Candidatus Methylacidiphilales bacterium]